jgi:hypothetical protein
MPRGPAHGVDPGGGFGEGLRVCGLHECGLMEPTRGSGLPCRLENRSTGSGHAVAKLLQPRGGTTSAAP